jgi:hypothetical protein
MTKAILVCASILALVTVGGPALAGEQTAKLVQHATAGRVTYRLTPWVPNNQNAEVSHNTIRMANSAPPATGSAQPG